ncbi:MAG: glycosyltransferase family 39 protein [Chlorobi bacterium]|nr:glycosyltransferase family 39 protein [Chlorobiota bacterium]
MNNNSITWRKRLYRLAFVSLLVRIVIAATIELGNDEVYYRLYALYPDWSHFDHPLMVGLAMQLFSLNLSLHSELFLRMSSIILGTINIFIVFDIGKNLKSKRVGFFSALLYTSSVYAFVITGIFILPDTPQQFFWLLSFGLMMQTLPACPNIKNNSFKMLKLGLLIGLAMISKYTSVFLWLAAGLYIVFFNREWLRKKSFYLSVLISFIICLPILIWNIQNDFISFTFHGERVDFVGYQINTNYFFTELLGEVLYNNPINYVLILMALSAVFTKKIQINKQHKQIILLSSLPLIILFLGFSLFRSTLPHWTAPGFTILIFLAALWLDTVFAEKSDDYLIPWPLKISVGLLVITLLLGYLQINQGIINIDKTTEYNRLGENDPSLDMFGYEQIADSFAEIYKRDTATGLMPKDVFMAGKNWFPLANLDYYVASPLGMKSYGFGDLGKIHKYAWINKINGDLRLGMDAYFITDSREYREPFTFFKEYFDKIEAADTIQVYRGGKIAKRAFVFRLMGLRKLPVEEE